MVVHYMKLVAYVCVSRFNFLISAWCIYCLDCALLRMELTKDLIYVWMCLHVFVCVKFLHVRCWNTVPLSMLRCVCVRSSGVVQLHQFVCVIYVSKLC